MNGSDIPDRDNVVRYAAPSHIDGGEVLGGAFCLRTDEAGLSINWLECFAGMPKAAQLDEVRRLSRLRMRRSGRLAELNVGAAKAHIKDTLDTLRFVKTPLDAEPPYDADPSHGDIFGLPAIAASAQAMLIGAMLAECVHDSHHAVAP